MPLDSSLTGYSLTDRYLRDDGTIFLSATQALIRVTLERRRIDLANGHDTAGLISGYRGSPLGGFDLELWKQSALLAEHRIVFQPGVNEELAATALWGTQQVGLQGGARHDGVFGFWYGKGPGVDRSGDAFKHANLAGTAALGGIVALVGDDHGAKSSTSAHQSDQALMAAMMPTLYPADIQEILDYGQFAIDLGRHSGCWTALKLVTEIAESSGTAVVATARHARTNDVPAPGDVHIRMPDDKLAAEARLLEVKLPAARAYLRAHGLDRVRLAAAAPRLGIVTAGKAFHDVMQALRDLGIDDGLAQRLGLTVYKVAMTWPLEPEGITRFARPLQELLVVEEKRGVVEPQLKETLFDRLGGSVPKVMGKFDFEGNRQFPEGGELTPDRVARAIAAWLAPHLTEMERTRVKGRLPAAPAEKVTLATQARGEFFCAGCPHNRSTRLPEGSMALAGIGCHTMASRIPQRNTAAPAQMGGEGGHWMGQAPFTDRDHVFQNIGDGTYYHSGILGIRAAVAAGVNVTFKLLYNGAVAMTGGQPVEGNLSIDAIARELGAEGASRIVVVTDDTGRHDFGAARGRGFEVRPRTELEAVQRELRDVPGVTVLIYDQACAAEKRRRRRRGTMPAAARRVFINERVCEGCGDCGETSSCVAVRPVDTPYGIKRRIDQSSCNIDLSCVEGFCPSFAVVEGAAPVEQGLTEPDAALVAALDDPPVSGRDGLYGMLLTGVGGTGVVTVSAVLGTAAHLDGSAVRILDVTGVAQKNGAVTCHLQWGGAATTPHAARLGRGRVDLVLACDAVVASSGEVRGLIERDRTAVVVNTDIQPTAAATFDPEGAPGAARVLADVAKSAERVEPISASGLAEALCGNTIYGNILQLGFAVQRGLVPIGRRAIERAIELNGVGVRYNKAAFDWGRLAAADLDAVLSAAGLHGDAPAPAKLDALVEDRRRLLTAYQNAALADRYATLVARVQAAERAVGRGDALARAVARGYAKLLAYKDEYEVARLYTDGEFRRALTAQFGTGGRPRIWLAPPILAARDPATGRPVKRSYGPWIFPILRLFAKARGIRGTAFDPFGRTGERREERRLIAEYEATIDQIIAGLTPGNLDKAVEIAGLADGVRGYGYVKEASIRRFRERLDVLMRAFPGAVPAGPARMVPVEAGGKAE